MTIWLLILFFKGGEFNWPLMFGVGAFMAFIVFLLIYDEEIFETPAYRGEMLREIWKAIGRRGQ